LKEELKKRGLDLKGLKADLVARLKEAVGGGDAGGFSSPEDDASSDSDAPLTSLAPKETMTVMVRKMAAHEGRAIGTKDKNARKSVDGEEKPKRKVGRPSRRARLAAKGIIEEPK
jgi:RNA exonuclease 1